MTQPGYGRSAPQSPYPGAAGASGDPYRQTAVRHGYAVEAEPSELGGVVRWSGAILSLALLAGMGFWGWKLAVRDVSGVPVVLALDRPMRVAPDAPGGAAIPHQGLAVNAVQEARGATPVPDQVRVIDETESLSAEDMERAEPVSDADRAAQTMALVDRLVADAVAEGANLETVSRSPAAQLPDLPVATLAPPVEGGIGRSLRPLVRPASFAPRTVASATPIARVAEEVVPGTRLVQLGAFDSAATAEAEWQRLLAGEFAPLLVDKARVVEQAESGGRTFYRLRAAGFADLGDARRFCAALLSGRADCIPVVAR